MPVRRSFSEGGNSPNFAFLLLTFDFPPSSRPKRSCLQLGPCLYLLRGHAAPQHCTSLTADLRQQPFALVTLMRGFTNDQQ